jgi:hypothetical protein
VAGSPCNLAEQRRSPTDAGPPDALREAGMAGDPDASGVGRVGAYPRSRATQERITGWVGAPNGERRRSERRGSGGQLFLAT